MNKKKVLRGLVILLILVVDIGLDRISKNYIRNNFYYHEEILPFKYNYHYLITRTENTGAFLSLGDSLVNPWRFMLLTLMPAAVLLFGLGYIILKTNLPKLTVLGVILVLAGGMGNLYDRIVYNSVTDFMLIKYKWFQTGVFNIADVSIMIGVGLLLIQSFMKDIKSKKSKAENVSV
ncbi:signal peptidase II [Mucilaginibacter sabulilitoris]|uniref:Lipoprotein signal peptidase n=1 Tax=Mucilaginibacter sabulilitoris TaxID=1173583 RepID=A0ABZ0TJD1_9SPHI|nr:signal peptidase II [Mucilaginibacter sabulilitoris]WPU93270.1 signal peptidase II [Mucilaginibacter sabulilitoris]